MQKKAKANGFSTFVFERGDGVLKRWAEPMQAWRLKSPENRALAHKMEWYLEERNLIARPAIGILSLSRFAEKLLWKAYKEYPNTRASVRAQRLFATIQKKMAQMRYRADKSGRLQTKVEKLYMKSTIRTLLVLARRAHEDMLEESHRVRPSTMRKALV